MDLVHYFINNHDNLFYLVAGVSLLLELTIMGLSGPLLFFAIASLITGILVSLGTISGWEMEALSLGILTALVTLVLWKPLKAFQNAGSGKDTSSDIIGKIVPVSGTVTTGGGSIRYSGVNWQAKLSRDASVTSIEEGEMCVISSVDGNLMLVKPSPHTP